MAEISVIVPVYNVETKLNRCLDSLKNQTFEDFEVLLVDDGSKDKSGRICDEYASADSRFKVFHLENGGVSSARNFGIENATGKYIAFVDSDDYVETKYLEVLREGVLEDVPLSICGVYYCAEGTQEKSAQKEYDDFIVEVSAKNEAVFAELLRENRLNYVYGKLYKRSKILENQIFFQKDISVGEDTIFVLDYLKKIDKLRIIGKAFYNYVKYQTGTLTSKGYPDLYDKCTFINKWIENVFKEIGVFGENVRNVINVRRIESARWAIDGFRKSKLNKRQKIASVDGVLKSQTLQGALEECDELDASFPDIKWIRKGSAKKLLRYYKRAERKEKFIRSFKIIVVKTVPKKVVKGVKKWLSNVRS